jgi:hypothetical protein
MPDINNLLPIFVSGQHQLVRLSVSDLVPQSGGDVIKDTLP